MPSIQEKIDEIVARFNAIGDWESRYREIIQLGKGLPELPDEHRTEANKVKGCQSQVWLVARVNDGAVSFQADSDAVLVKGLVALLLEVFNGHSPAEILAADSAFVDRLGLMEHLSQTRSNGLSAMLKQIKLYAFAFDALQKSRQP